MVGRGVRLLSVALSGVLALAGLPTGALAEVATNTRPRATRTLDGEQQLDSAPAEKSKDVALSCRMLLHRLGEDAWVTGADPDPLLWPPAEGETTESGKGQDVSVALDGMRLVIPGVGGVRYRLLTETGDEQPWSVDGEPCVVDGPATGIEFELDDEAASRVALSVRTCTLGPDGPVWGSWLALGESKDEEAGAQEGPSAQIVDIEVKVEEALPEAPAMTGRDVHRRATRPSSEVTEEADEDVTPASLPSQVEEAALDEATLVADETVAVEIKDIEESSEGMGAPLQADSEDLSDAGDVTSDVVDMQEQESAQDAEPLAAQQERTEVTAEVSVVVPETPVTAGEETSPVQQVTEPRDVALLPQSVAWARLFGDTRYDTMAKIAETGFTSESVAILTTGKNFPDALAASALAGYYGCPILLTETGSLGSQASGEIERLGVERVLMLGGTGALSEDIEYELDALGVAHERIFGATRQETSLKVFEHLAGLGAVSTFAIVASGQGFADALSISPWAYANHVPILLTGESGTLSDAEVEALGSSGVTKVVIVGGEAAVSGEVEAQLADFDGTRLSGADRYATSERIARFEEASGLGWEVPYVCTGKAFPDALAGSALAGSTSSILLIADDPTDETLELLRERQDLLDHGVIFGGKQAFSLDDPLSLAPADPEPGTQATGDKVGYQNPEGFYQVSPKTVTITSQATAPWNYVTPSRISADATREDCVNAFIERAREYIGAPYVWNYSCAPEVGVDCIGLVYQCAYACGMDLGGGTGDEDFNPWAHYITGYSGWHSHDANNFWDYGRAMHVSLADRKPGDLISYPGHIGIYLGDDEMIHAYTPDTGVIYDSIWSPGTPRGCIRLFQ